MFRQTERGLEVGLFVEETKYESAQAQAEQESKQENVQGVEKPRRSKQKRDK